MKVKSAHRRWSSSLLKLQREDDLFPSSMSDYKPQLTVEELNALDVEAKEVEAALSDVDDLEPINEANTDLESINDIDSDDELEGIDE